MTRIPYIYGTVAGQLHIESIEWIQQLNTSTDLIHTNLDRSDKRLTRGAVAGGFS